MVKVVNLIETAAACVGNHDLVCFKTDAGPWRGTSELSHLEVSVSMATFKCKEGFGR